MRFLNLFTLAVLPLSVLADAPTILAALDSVSAAVAVMTAATAALSATADPKAQAADLSTKSAAVLQALKDGTVAIAATSAVTDATQATTIVTAQQKLAEDAGKTIDAFIAKKPLIDAGQQASVVLERLHSQYEATDAFGKAIVSKLPAAHQAHASQIAAQALTNLNKGMTAFGMPM